MSLPRTIWTLWVQGRESAPPLVRSYLKSWEQLNPNWEFRCLAGEDIEEHLDVDAILGSLEGDIPPHHLSDILRVNLLRRKGGIWVDATCLCMLPLDDWIGEYIDSGFFAFCKPGPDRLISSWFIASKKGCPLISQYCDVVNSYCNANDFEGPQTRFSRYAAELSRRFVGDDPWRSALYASPLYAWLVGFTPYFWFHYAFAYTLLTSRAARHVWRATPKVSSDYSNGDGPHAIQYHGMFNDIPDSLAARISARDDPMYKLDWKKSAKQELPLADVDPQRAVKYAMREVGVQPSTD